MSRILAIALILALSACGSDLFQRDDTPRTATEVAYAKDVCETAGRQSRACIDARHQMDLQCFATIGTVDCYRTSDPFGTANGDRSVVAPIDRRTAPQPLDRRMAEPEPPTEQPEPVQQPQTVPPAAGPADTAPE